MEQFIMGAIAMASTVAALFFLRFWRDTGDRLFAMFALAFLLLGITRLGLSVGYDRTPPPTVQTTERIPMRDELLSRTEVVPPPVDESQTHWYWVRLVAFLLILAAIIDKNRR